MLDRLKRLRDAARKAADAARTGPADALKNVTEGMLRKAASSGVPSEAVHAGSAAAARLWTRIAPDDPLAHARLGEALLRDGRAREAADVLRRGASASSAAGLLAEAWLARAEVLTDQAAQALSRIERVAARLPTGEPELDGQIRGALAAGALDAFRPELAARVLGDGGDDPLSALCRARLALAAGDTVEAKARARHASAAGLPEEAAVWIGLAMAVEGDLEGAESMLEGTRTRGPDRAFADAGTGWLLLGASGQGAAPVLEAAVERLPTHAGAMMLRGVAAEREGDSAGARSWYERAAAVDPGWPAPWLGIVRSAIAAGDHVTARGAAARFSGAGPERLLGGLAAALAGEAKEAEALWQASVDGGDRESLRELALLRAAVASRLSAEGRAEAAAAAWHEVARRASHAGPARHQVARWAIAAARAALESTQPAYYAVEAALGAATVLRPQSQELLVGHCSAMFLARGPAAARSALERAVSRGATDERVLGLLGLIDAATRGGPLPQMTVPRASAALEAARKAREGDPEGCLRQLDQAMLSTASPAVRAVVTGARALARLSEEAELLRAGRFEEAVEVMSGALEHLPDGLERDRLLHDLAAVATLAARRLDQPARSAGEPPPEPARRMWQASLRHWVALGAASAFWADMSKRVLELDDPRLGASDVDTLRASAHAVAVSLPAAFAREALVAGRPQRARAFVDLVLGAPVSDSARREALAEALSPITEEAGQVASEARDRAVSVEPQRLMGEWRGSLEKIHDLQARLAEAAPAGLAPASDARDDLAVGLVAYFENLHDRAGELRAARAALAEAAAVAGSETLRAELEGKLARMEGRR